MVVQFVERTCDTEELSTEYREMLLRTTKQQGDQAAALKSAPPGGGRGGVRSGPEACAPSSSCLPVA